MKNDAFYLVASRATGLEALRWQEQDFLISGPRLQIWRGPTDNDGIKGWTDETWRPLNKWRAQGLDKLAVKTVSAKARRNKDGSITFLFEHLCACAASDRAVRHQHSYTISPDGRIQADNTFTIDKAIPDLPRLGVVLTLKPGFEKLSWLGRGPFENYSDRKRAALVDLYESTVTDQYVPYIMPQEHGNHTDVRWLSLGCESAKLLVEAVGPMEFSASHYTAQDLDSATIRMTFTREQKSFLASITASAVSERKVAVQAPSSNTRLNRVGIRGAIRCSRSKPDLLARRRSVCSARGSDYQLKRDDILLTSNLLSIHQCNRSLSKEFPLFKPVRADRSERGIGKWRCRNVIVSNHGEVFRNGKSGFTNGHHRPDRERVVTGEKRCWMSV